MTVNIKDVVSAYVQGTVNKSNLSGRSLLRKAVFAGIFIGMGAAGSSVAAHSVSNVGLARALAGTIFPVGLMMVILLGAELFTGDCLAVMAMPEKKISVKALLKILASVYVGNFIGAALLALFVSLSGQFDYSSGLLGAYTIKVALGKVNLSFGTAVVSGILCNILVCAAVLMAGCAKDVAGKLLVCFFVIMLFVTAGFEHCVANMYYITAGLLAKLNPQYVNMAMQSYGIGQEALEQLNLVNFLFRNLLPVTIGNIIGGSLVMGLPIYYINTNEQKEKITVKEVQRNGSNVNDRTSRVAG